MTTPKTKPSNKVKPKLGRLYLQGLVVYVWYRLADLGYAVLRLLTAPVRWLWRPLENRWWRVKPWLVRHKRRLLWSALALVLFSALLGSAVTLYLWRDEALALVFRLQHLVARLFRKTEPVIVVATQVAEPIPSPVMPGVDGPLR